MAKIRLSQVFWKPIKNRVSPRSALLEAAYLEALLYFDPKAQLKQQLKVFNEQRDSGFVRAQITERTMQYHVAQPPVANMALNIGDMELSIPQGTPAIYLAELIEALRS